MRSQLRAMDRADLALNLYRGALELGLEPGAELVDRLLVLSRELHKWNRVHNLSGHKTEKGIIGDLILDSLVLEPWVPGNTLLDIGSGAGFPGLVLALARPGLVVTLLESRGKRVSFQEHAVRILGLGDRVRPVQGRAGAGALAGRRFDSVVLRAVAGLRESLDLARGYLGEGGVVLLPRGVRDRESGLELGGRVLREYRLPGGGGDRVILAFHVKQ